jgi:hypothetical protein
VGSLISRRSFLLGTAAALGAAACGGGSKHVSAGAPTSDSVIKVPATDAKSQLNLLETSAQYFSAVDQRVAFVLRSQQDFVTPDSSATLRFGADTDHLGAPVPIVIHADAGTAPAYLTATYQFPQPGTYWARVILHGKSADAPLQVIDPSTSQIPIPGQPMISTPTPTPSDHRGVEPICTRNPACPWHDVGLDVALSERRPIALLFATPALCQTATCGPVLDTLLSLKSQYESRVRFLHSEIYTDMSAKTNTPAVLAYHLQSEPMLFFAGADGIVKTRLDGLYGHGEAAQALAGIAGS